MWVRVRREFDGGAPMQGRGRRESGEHLGELRIGYAEEGGRRVRVARLLNAQAMRRHDWMGTELFDAVVDRVETNRLRIRGLERSGERWVLQVWHCIVQADPVAPTGGPAPADAAREADLP